MLTPGLFIDLITKAPEFYFSIVIAVVISVVLHELGHGVAAIWQGDDTPRVTGHMTWNPLVHMGGFSLFLLFFAGIAFGQMPVNPHRFRSRYGNALVAAAGPAVNLVLALIGLTIFALWIKLGGVAGVDGRPSVLQEFFFLFGMLNIVLCVFNMLPIPPLDGSTVLRDFSGPYRRLTSDPNNQPFFLGAFLLVFFFADWIFDTARTVANAYIGLFFGA
ncbi:MAG: site-2 protease family protein [Planctomycetota bacterium]|nr:site-2 protease family protein [Planctomycetota bacterium]